MASECVTRTIPAQPASLRCILNGASSHGCRPGPKILSRGHKRTSATPVGRDRPVGLAYLPPMTPMTLLSQMMMTSIGHLLPFGANDWPAPPTLPRRVFLRTSNRQLRFPQATVMSRIDALQHPEIVIRMA